MTEQLDYKIMEQSYNNISFYSERRAKSDYEHYSSQLNTDLRELEGNEGNYESKYINKVMNIFHKQSSCASAFICGPANFNNRRNQKKWDSRDKAYNDFEHWRSRYFKAVNRVRTLSPEDELDKAIERLEFLETEKAKPNSYSHEYLSIKAPEDTCSIYNCTLKIRETKKKILVMHSRIKEKDLFGIKKFIGGSIYIENDRVIVHHNEKPSVDIIQAIKSHGFKWSPKMGNWCRKHTMNARYRAEDLLNDFLL